MQTPLTSPNIKKKTRAAEEDAGLRPPMSSFSELASGGVEGPGMRCQGSGLMGCRGSGLAAAAAGVATESPSSLVSAQLQISVVLGISELLVLKIISETSFFSHS